MKIIIDVDLGKIGARDERITASHKISPRFGAVVIGQFSFAPGLILKVESIHCMVMLEDQTEERACLFALGLLDEGDAPAFEAEMFANPDLRRVVTDFEEALANLSLAVTANRVPSADLRRQLFDRIDAEPARVITDVDGRIQIINPAFTRLCGYRIEELRGRKPGCILQGPATDPAPAVALRAAIRAGIACEVEIVNYHKNGSPYNVRIAIDPIRDAQDVLTGFRATEHEISPATA